MHTSVKFKKQWGQYNGGETLVATPGFRAQLLDVGAVAGFSAEELAKVPTEVYDLVEKKPTDEKPAELAPVDPLAPVP